MILGLLLVIVEVRQNAELTRTQMEQRKNDFLAEIEFSLANRGSAVTAVADAARDVAVPAAAVK